MFVFSRTPWFLGIGLQLAQCTSQTNYLPFLCHMMTLMNKIMTKSAHFAEKFLPNLQCCKDTWEFIQEKNPLSVLFVRNHLTRKTPYRLIWENIQETDHIHAHFVKITLLKKAIWKPIFKGAILKTPIWCSKDWKMKMVCMKTVWWLLKRLLQQNRVFSQIKQTVNFWSVYVSTLTRTDL